MSNDFIEINSNIYFVKSRGSTHKFFLNSMHHFEFQKVIN